MEFNFGGPGGANFDMGGFASGFDDILKGFGFGGFGGPGQPQKKVKDLFAPLPGL
jgi:hypothetical protein